MLLRRAVIVFMSGAWVFAHAGVIPAAHAEADADESAGTIEQLLKSGWQIAGYASNSDSRSTFILFKNPNESYLVQCLAGYDVTRSPRIFQNCYRLR
jgi:hypothetical protein